MTEMDPGQAIGVTRIDSRLPIGYISLNCRYGRQNYGGTLSPQSIGRLSQASLVSGLLSPSPGPCVQDGTTINPETLVPAQNSQHHAN